MARRESRIFVAILALSILNAGCGSKYIPIQGSVTLDGKPLTGATVTFLLQSRDGRSAQSVIDEEGVWDHCRGNVATNEAPGEFRGPRSECGF